MPAATGLDSVLVSGPQMWKPPSWQHSAPHALPRPIGRGGWGRIIPRTRPISHGACATHVFLFNLLVLSSSATTRTLPAIFPCRLGDKRITDVERVGTWPPPPPPPPVLRLVCDNLCTPPLSRSFASLEACPSLVLSAGTLSCAFVPPSLPRARPH